MPLLASKVTDFGPPCTSCKQFFLQCTFFSYRCQDYRGPNCAECDTKVCTKLISEDIGTLCSGQGIYCLAINNKCATCACVSGKSTCLTSLTLAYVLLPG